MTVGAKLSTATAFFCCLQFLFCAYLFFPNIYSEENKELTRFILKEISLNERAKILTDISELFDRFAFLDGKSLLSEEEEEEYNAIISNEEAITHASNYLLHGTQGKFDDDLIYTRVNAVEFLKNAVAWQENPKRREAIDAISRVLIQWNENERFPYRDFVDLFAELYRHAPTEASAIL